MTTEEKAILRKEYDERVDKIKSAVNAKQQQAHIDKAFEWMCAVIESNSDGYRREDIEYHEGTLEEFIADAEIILCGTLAYGKGLVARIEQGHRGDLIRFRDGLYTWGYRVTGKLVKLQADKTI